MPELNLDVLDVFWQGCQESTMRSSLFRVAPFGLRQITFGLLSTVADGNYLRMDLLFAVPDLETFLQNVQFKGRIDVWEYIKLGNATVPFLCYNVKFYTNFLQEHGR
jgi:hypothetical protein